MSRRQQTPLQRTFYEIIFGTDTPAGKWFDIALIVAILASVAVIMLDSIHKPDEKLRDSRNCTNCAAVEHEPEAHYCRFCAAPLPKPGHAPD